MAGAGNQPAGTSNAGLGSPGLSTEQTGRLFREPNTGRSLNSRRFDPVTRRYVVDDRARVLGMTRAQQFVYLAVATDLGSSAVATLGNRLKTIKTIGHAFANELEQVFREALAPGVANGLIEILSIEAQRFRSTGAYVIIRWRDLETGQIETSRAG